MRGGVFVCHASEDAGAAQRVVAALEAAGMPCWVAPRDIDPGESYTRAILDGLEAAPAMVLVFSAATNDSPHVTRELESAVGRAIPIVPVRLEQVEPSRDLRYFIGTSQWLETAGDAAEQWESPLVRAVRRAVGGSGPRTASLVQVTAVGQPASPDAERGRRLLPWGAAGAALVLVVVVVVVVLVTRSGDETNVPEGRAGMAGVFPSLDEDCKPKDQPAVEAKSEVYVCDHDEDSGYEVWYSRWDDDYDRAGFFNTFTSRSTDLHAVDWVVRDHDVGSQWSYQVDDLKHPYRWSATYADLPFSVDVLAVSGPALTLGQSEVTPALPDEVDGN